MLLIVLKVLHVFYYVALESLWVKFILRVLKIVLNKMLKCVKNKPFRPKRIVLIDFVLYVLRQENSLQHFEAQKTLKSAIHVASVADVGHSLFPCSENLNYLWLWPALDPHVTNAANRLVLFVVEALWHEVALKIAVATDANGRHSVVLRLHLVLTLRRANYFSAKADKEASSDSSFANLALKGVDSASWACCLSHVVFWKLIGPYTVFYLKIRVVKDLNEKPVKNNAVNNELVFFFKIDDCASGHSGAGDLKRIYSNVKKYHSEMLRRKYWLVVLLNAELSKVDHAKWRQKNRERNLASN